VTDREQRWNSLFAKHFTAERASERLAEADAVLSKPLHLCPKCGCSSVEIISTQHPVGLTGIRRCLSDSCDHTFDPTFEVKP
jgi:hypothetical protein